MGRVWSSPPGAAAERRERSCARGPRGVSDAALRPSLVGDVDVLFFVLVCSDACGEGLERGEVERYAVACKGPGVDVASGRHGGLDGGGIGVGEDEIRCSVSTRAAAANAANPDAAASQTLMAC